MATISFSEATGGPVPKVEIEIFLRGAGSLPGTSDYRDIWVAAAIDPGASGTASADDVTTSPFGSLDDAIAWYGDNSEGAHMCAYIWHHREPRIGKFKGDVYGIALAESAGVAATQTLTFATNASGSGYWTFSVGGHPVTFNVSSGDTPTVQGDNFVTAYDALDYHEKPPITVANAVGTVTLTFNAKGGNGNTIGLSTVHDPDVTTTATWGAANMAGGTLYYDHATALAKLTSTRTPVIVTPIDLDYATAGGAAATELHDLIDHVNTKANATNMLGATIIAADVDTHTNLASDADGIDDDDGQRFCAVGINGSETWTGEIAAKFAAAQGAEKHLARSLNGLRLVGVDAPSTADVFTEAELEACIEGGVTPLWVPPGETTVQICRAVSVRTEYGVMDWALLTVLDYVRDSLQARLSTAFERASIVADTAEVPDAAHVFQPKDVKALAHEVLKELEEEGYLTDVDTYWEDVEGNLSGSTYQMAIPLEMVPQWHNTQIRLDHEVG